MNEPPVATRSEWEILSYPDPRLRRKAKLVAEVTDAIRKKGLALMDLMHEVRGVGIAAPQVGWNVRILAINLTGRRGDGLVFANPLVVEKSKATFAASEACLSVPGVSGKVVRPRAVKISAMNMDGEINPFELDGMLARCFLHELDHLDGVLFVDRLSPAKKLSIRRQLKKLGGPE